MQAIADIIFYTLFTVVVITIVYNLISWCASTPEQRERRKANSISPSEMLKKKAKRPGKN